VPEPYITVACRELGGELEKHGEGPTLALRSVYCWGEDPWQKQNKKPHVVLNVVGKRRLSIPLHDNNLQPYHPIHLQPNNRYISALLSPRSAVLKLGSMDPKDFRGSVTLAGEKITLFSLT